VAGGDLIFRAVGIVGVGRGAARVGTGAIIVIVVAPNQVLNDAGGGVERCDDKSKPEKKVTANVGAWVNPFAVHEEDAEIGETPDEGKRELGVLLARVCLAGRGEIAR